MARRAVPLRQLSLLLAYSDQCDVNGECSSLTIVWRLVLCLEVADYTAIDMLVNASAIKLSKFSQGCCFPFNLCFAIIYDAKHINPYSI